MSKNEIKMSYKTYYLIIMNFYAIFDIFCHNYDLTKHVVFLMWLKWASKMYSVKYVT